MSFILFCVAWIIGLFVGAFFLIQPLIVLFFGIPFTLKLKKFDMLKGNGPLFSYIISLILLPSLFALITWGIYLWIPKQMIGYWIGVGISLLLGLGKCGTNPANVSEYLQTNASAIKPEAMKQFLPDSPTSKP